MTYPLASAPWVRTGACGAEGLRMEIFKALLARRMPPSDRGRAAMINCSDVATLTRWLERARTATSEAEVFAGGCAP